MPGMQHGVPRLSHPGLSMIDQHNIDHFAQCEFKYIVLWLVCAPGEQPILCQRHQRDPRRVPLEFIFVDWPREPVVCVVVQLVVVHVYRPIRPQRLHVLGEVSRAVKEVSADDRVRVVCNA
eukprot:scaffold74728_cov33-Prasinocladus_malaysianus.AAC.2